MQRDQFQELLTRAAALCSPHELIIFGSQAIHALTASPPAEVIISVECDLWFPDNPVVVSRITTALGRDSEFARVTGVYADLLPPELPLLPEGWQERLVPYCRGNVSARCLEIHDLIVSKLAAGRLKDYEFIVAVLLLKLARVEEVQRRIRTFSDPHAQAVLLARLRIATESSDVPL